MSRKHAATSEQLFQHLALNAVASYIQTMNSTLDTSSLSAKVEILTNMAQLIEDAIVQLEENSELNK